MFLFYEEQEDLLIIKTFPNQMKSFKMIRQFISDSFALKDLIKSN